MYLGFFTSVVSALGVAGVPILALCSAALVRASIRSFIAYDVSLASCFLALLLSNWFIAFSCCFKISFSSESVISRYRCGMFFRNKGWTKSVQSFLFPASLFAFDSACNRSTSFSTASCSAFGKAIISSIADLSPLTIRFASNELSDSIIFPPPWL